MSYILDALRKSEQERQMAAGQPANVFQATPMEMRRAAKPSYLVPVAVGLVAIVVAALIWWQAAPRAPVEPVTPPPAVAAMPPAVNVAPVAPVAEPAPPPPPVPVRAAKPAPPTKEVVAPPPKADVPPAPTPVAATAPVAVPAQEEEMPAISIKGYIFDEGQGSMAMINDKLVREGEEILPGLRLEKVLPNGAVFSYKGRRFTR